jgi:hypothetical protein
MTKQKKEFISTVVTLIRVVSLPVHGGCVVFNKVWLDKLNKRWLDLPHWYRYLSGWFGENETIQTQELKRLCGKK